MIKFYGPNSLKGCGAFHVFGSLDGDGTGDKIKFQFFSYSNGNGNGKGWEDGYWFGFFSSGGGESEDPHNSKEEFTI